MSDKKLYVLTYDHGGYVLWNDEVERTIKEDLELLEKYPKFKTGLDYESFTFDEYSKTRPHIMDLIKESLEKYKGRFSIGATTYGQPLSLFVSEESNARQLLYAVRTNLKHFGQTPPVYVISEFALNNQIPQLARLCGYDAAILRSHVMGYGYPRTFDSAWGNWIGKDGTSIPAVPTYDEQGRGYNCTTFDNWIISRWPEDTDDSLADFKKMFEKYEPLLASRYDDLTQLKPYIPKDIQEHDDYECILLEEIMDLYGEAKDEYRTTDNDFHTQMPWGYCGNEIFNGCRESEVEAVQAEKLNAFVVMLGGESQQETLEEAWKNALVAQHHDVTICGLLDLAHRFIPDSLKLSSEAKAQSKDALAKRFADKDGESLLVINGHSFKKREWVAVETDKELCAFDGDKALNCEKITVDGKNYLRVEVEVEPLTIKRISLRDGKSDSKSDYSWCEECGVLSTPLYNVKLTDKGIAYIEFKSTGKRIFDNGDGELFKGWINDADYCSDSKWTVTVSAHSALAVSEGEIGGIPYRFEMNFIGSEDRIDCKVRFDMNNERVGAKGITDGLSTSLSRNGHRHEDKIRFIMNTCLDNDRRMVRDLPYAISDWNGQVRRTEDYWYKKDKILIDVEVSPEESFNDSTYLSGVYWISLRDKNQGIAVMNRGCMGSVVQGNLVTIPLIYADEYICGKKMLTGSFENEFSLLPFDASLSDADLHRKAMAYEYLPTAYILPQGEGDMSSFAAADFKSEGGEVILTSIYPEDGAILARFCNYSDDNASAVFTANVGKVAAETDLLGNELKKVEDGKLEFHPWEVKTVRIEL